MNSLGEGLMLQQRALNLEWENILDEWEDMIASKRKYMNAWTELDAAILYIVQYANKHGIELQNKDALQRLANRLSDQKESVDNIPMKIVRRGKKVEI